MFVEVFIVILKVVQHTVYSTILIIGIERLKADIVQSDIVSDVMIFSIYWYS